MNKIQDKSVSSVKSFFAKYNLIPAIIVIIIVGFLLKPTFLSAANIQVILLSCSVYGFIAIAQSVVLIAREIDLSVGVNMVFSGTCSIYIANFLIQAFTGTQILHAGFVTGGYPLLVIFTVLLAAGVGLLNGVIVVKAKIPSFISTLGMSYTLQGIGYLLTKGIPLFYKDMPDAVFIGNFDVANVIPLSLIILIVAAVILYIMYSKTKFGMRMYSTGGNEKAAIFSGINTGKWKIIAFTLAGLLVGIGSLLYSSRLQGVDVSQGTGYNMTSIAIAIIGGISLTGGKGSIAGTVQATFIFAMLINILNLQGLMGYYSQAITGGVIIAIAVLHKREESKRLKALKIIEI